MSRFVALVILIAILPLLFLITLIQLLVFFRIFYVHTRVGCGGKTFGLYKFMSMYPARKASKSENERLGIWGHFLRKTSLDELPQLWNIARGDMNFVGPRPLLPEYLRLYNPRQAKRHAVKPGITGWAQIHGRNKLSWEKQFEMDVWYVEHRNFMLDIKILLHTIGKLFTTPKEEVEIREKFKGSG